MFRLAKAGFLSRKFLKLQNNRPPCVSCLFGQAHRKPWRYKSSTNGVVSELRGPALSKPGQTIGADQLISAQPGLVPQEKGCLTRARIWAATVFVDYYTKFVHVSLMADQTAESTLEAKHSFEHYAATRGVEIQHYQADNGIFTDKLFSDDVKSSMQRLTLCGVGAHHQNGVVERAIKSLTLISRTLLLHAQRHWPEYITTMLWPFALKAAQDRMNQLHVNLDGTNPKGVPKWEPQARLGIYVGRSSNHAGNVALVLNPKTGLVSPQFHVVFDDEFTTVPHLRKGTVPSNWATLVEHSSEKVTSEFYDLTKTWFDASSDESADEIIIDAQMNEPVTTAPEGDSTQAPLSSSNSANEGANGDPLPPIVSQSQNHKGELHIPSSQDSEGEIDDNMQMPPMINLDTAGLRRSPGLEAARNKNGLSFTSIITKICAFGMILSTYAEPTTAFSTGQAAVNSLIHKCNVVNSNFDNTLNSFPTFVLAAGKENNECYTFKEMLSQPDWDKFLQAMLKESAEHENRNHWSVVLKSSMPEGTKPIQAIWSFKRKRFPDGSLNKHKARLCAHGGMQQWGVNYWETYAPVINWISVRFLLILAQIFQLDTRAIDFVLAFPQAKLDVPVYMYVPAGMQLQGIQGDTHHMYILKLEKSLYGLKQASANWYEMLKSALQHRGFS
ncbi:hypothetical protein ACHAXS_005121 [Conticribra weissflogii]